MTSELKDSRSQLWGPVYNGKEFKGPEAGVEEGGVYLIVVGLVVTSGLSTNV